MQFPHSRLYSWAPERTLLAQHQSLEALVLLPGFDEGQIACVFLRWWLGCRQLYRGCSDKVSRQWSQLMPQIRWAHLDSASVCASVKQSCNAPAGCFSE